MVQFLGSQCMYTANKDSVKSTWCRFGCKSRRL